jgi:hypothetical protein
MFFFRVDGQYGPDTTLFKIKLNSDSNSLFYCGQPEEISQSLSGPILMAGKTLLFYSAKGYVLYEINGIVVDSQSLSVKNKNCTNPYILSYPIDSSTVLYYRRKAEAGGVSLEIYSKNLYQKLMKPVTGIPYQQLKPVISSSLFNCAWRTASDEVLLKNFLAPRQVGFTFSGTGSRWWCLEKFYTFTSPLIADNNGAFVAFFPGFDFRYYPSVPKSLIEPLGVVRRSDEWYYYGTSLAKQSSKTTDSQMVYICDQRGNLLDSVKLFKREVVDDVLGENVAEKMLFTVKKTGRYAFLPSIDAQGHIYYAIIDYRASSIEVRWRPYRYYKSIPGGPTLEEELEYERGISLVNAPLECTQGRQVRLRLPTLNYTDLNDSTKRMTESQLTKEGFCARLARFRNPDLAAALKRKQAALPRQVQRLQDSLSHEVTERCPWRMFVHKGIKGVIASLNYGLTDSVVAARVIAVTTVGDLYIRVDCQDRAEMVIFSGQGAFRNRFVFNHQPAAIRKDLIAVSAKGIIAEKDYEVQANGYRFFNWQLSGPIAIEEKIENSVK